ncbi:hypothetical protein [Ruania albidiflava]|uniref:hypothetical protein n=1 Tax=Ruania albidiflava TaxID=366586 RepID=UPI0023F2D7EC|nr:hypothetical protein [Ruania albidiflava]
MVTQRPISLGTPRGRRTRWTPPLMACAAAVVIGALWSGLVHLGLPLPEGGTSLHEGHGPMMILGFLGTVITLERAVALGRAWAYLGPATAGLGGVAVLVGGPSSIGPVLLTVAGVVLLAVFVAVHRIQPSVHNAVMAAGALCWIAAGGLWLAGWDVERFVPHLAGFLVLTIAGERLELSRLVGATGRSRAVFVAIVAVLLVGLVLAAVAPPVGIRTTGAALLGLAVWLARNDVARRTVRMTGAARYMAVALLAGYLWMAVTGVLWLWIGRLHDGGPHQPYDAMLHALFLGFVISMIFAHAPVVIPAVLGRPLPYRPAFYLPLLLLHSSLLLRLVGGVAGQHLVLWQWGGVLNEVALLMFIAMVTITLVRSRRRRTAAAR